MFRNVFLKTLWESRKGLAGWMVGLFLLSLMIVAMYPSIHDSSETLNQFMTELPPEMQALAGNIDQFNYSTFTGFLAIEIFGLFLPALTLGFAIAYGSNLIAGEEESGTFSVLLATPVPRWRVGLEKFAAVIVFALLALFAFFAGLVIGSAVIAVDDAAPRDLLAGVLDVVPFTLFFAALAFCITGLRSGRGLALVVTIALATVGYLVDALAVIADLPGWLQQLSPWYYYGAGAPLQNGLNPADSAVLLVAVVLLVGAGIWGFEKRDITV